MPAAVAHKANASGHTVKWKYYILKNLKIILLLQ